MSELPGVWHGRSPARTWGAFKSFYHLNGIWQKAGFIFIVSLPLSSSCHPLLPSPLPRKLRQQERHNTNHTKFVNVPCGGEVSLRLRLCSRFINLPSIISANPATRQCHVPPGQTGRQAALSQCSLHKRNPPRPGTAGESADGCFNERARATLAGEEGFSSGWGVPIPTIIGLLRRQFLASIFVCPPTSIGGHGEFYMCPAGHVIDGLDVIRRQYLTKSIMDFY